MVYGRYEDFSKGRQLDKAFKDKAFIFEIKDLNAEGIIGTFCEK